jgi:hypothetical protein
MLDIHDPKYHAHLATCARCPNKRQAGQVKVCTFLVNGVEDGRSVFVHAAEGACPADRYANPEPVSQIGGSGPVTMGPPKPRTQAQTRQVLAELKRVPEARWGDVVERWARAVGADRAAKLFEDVTGLPCGCEGRKKFLNKVGTLAKAVVDRMREQLRGK